MMTKARSPEASARPYTPPRLIRPEAEDLSPEAKGFPTPAEAGTSNGPS